MNPFGADLRSAGPKHSRKGLAFRAREAVGFAAEEPPLDHESGKVEILAGFNAQTPLTGAEGDASMCHPTLRSALGPKPSVGLISVAPPHSAPQYGIRHDQEAGAVLTPGDSTSEPSFQEISSGGLAILDLKGPSRGCLGSSST